MLDEPITLLKNLATLCAQIYGIPSRQHSAAAKALKGVQALSNILCGE